MAVNFEYQHISIPYYSNLHTDSLGLDSLKHCFNQKDFKLHDPVIYKFNEIGFRTHSVKKFDSNAILVLGDSFTLGLGINTEYRYSDILEQRLSHQVLNFSLNGASNDWIFRKLQQLLTIFNPRAIIVHYTFSHRRERPEIHWHDDERTECKPFYSPEENFDNWFNNFKSISRIANNFKLLHSFITNWHDQDLDYSEFGPNVVAPFNQSDWARDHFHYGPITHQILADKLFSLI
jgi:hypothetical protein